MESTKMTGTIDRSTIERLMSEETKRFERDHAESRALFERATIALLEARTRNKVAIADWITVRKDQERFRARGYQLESPDPGTSMTLSLDGRLDRTELLEAFGVTAGVFAHYPTESF